MEIIDRIENTPNKVDSWNYNFLVRKRKSKTSPKSQASFQSQKKLL